LLASSRQLSKRSRHAMIVNSWRALRSGVKVPRQRSLSKKAIGASCHAAAPTSRQRIAASILSWPSPKMSASTITASPATVLAGKRPPSISGETASIATRAPASAGGSGAAVFARGGARRLGGPALRAPLDLSHGSCSPNLWRDASAQATDSC
jgi:hypothetical protein